MKKLFQRILNIFGIKVSYHKYYSKHENNKSCEITSHRIEYMSGPLNAIIFTETGKQIILEANKKNKDTLIIDNVSSDARADLNSWITIMPLDFDIFDKSVN